MLTPRRLVALALLGLSGSACTSRLDISGVQDTGESTEAADAEGDMDDGGEAADDYGDDWMGPSCGYAYLDVCVEPGPDESCGNGKVEADEICDDDGVFGTFDGCTRSCRLGPLLLERRRTIYPAEQRVVSTGLELSQDGQTVFDGVQIEMLAPSDPLGQTWASSVDGSSGAVVANLPLRDRFDDGGPYLAHEQTSSATSQRVAYQLGVDAAGGQGEFEMPVPLAVPSACVWRSGGVDLRIGRFTTEGSGGAPQEIAGVVGFDVGSGANGTATVETLFESDAAALEPEIGCARLSSGGLAYTWYQDGRYHVRTQAGVGFTGNEIQGDPVTADDPITPGIIALGQGRAAWLDMSGDAPELRVGDPAIGASASATLPHNGVAWESLDPLGEDSLAVRGRHFGADEAVWQVYDGQANARFEIRRPASSSTTLFDAQRVGDDTIAWLIDGNLMLTDVTGYSAWSVDLPAELGLDTLWSLPDGRVLVLGAADDHLSMAIVSPETREHDYEIHEFETGSQVELVRVLQATDDILALATMSTLPNGDRAYDLSFVQLD